MGAEPKLARGWKGMDWGSCILRKAGKWLRFSLYIMPMMVLHLG